MVFLKKRRKEKMFYCKNSHLSLRQCAKVSEGQKRGRGEHKGERVRARVVCWTRRSFKSSLNRGRASSSRLKLTADAEGESGMGKRTRDDDRRKGDKKDKDASDGDSSDGEGDMPTFQGSQLFPNFPSCVLCIH
jgi:hypothetical protein